MKRDYYSDIKLAERIIFQNTAYLLTMIDKKVDSFTSQKTPNMRARERNDLLHPDNVLHPEAPRAILNPLATLANDLTKPVWNCITRVEPVAVSLLPQFGSQTQAQRLISAFNQSMIRFFQRFKYEHQDEVSLKLHINLVDRLNKVKSLLADFEQKKPNQNQLLLQKLFGMLQAVYRLKFSNSTAQEYLAILQTLQKSTLKDPVRGVYINPDIVADVTVFVQQIEQYIKNVAESLSGPVYINYTLQQQKLSLILHPMMLAIYCSIKNQINHQEEGKEDMNSKNSFFQSKVNTEPPIFQQLKSYNCSKITFINMDGYQSSSNLFLAKHLRKYLQYISFPLQEQSFLNNNMQLNDLASYYRWRSQILAKQYMACFYEHQANINLYGGKDSNQRQTFEQLFKRLLVIPVNSLYISNKTDAPSISGFQSQFVYFMMKEIIYNQIRQFGPSVIIVSHSKTLPMLSSHLQQIFAQLSILTNMKIIFYNNITHSIVPYVTEQKKDYFLSNHIKYYTLKQQWSSPLAFHNQVQRFPITIDMLERASIFFKICSGTANLTFEARQSDQKFYNSKILRYSGLLMRKIGQKHPVLSKFDHRFLHYLKIDKLFTNYPQNDQNLSVYHRRVFDLAQKELILRYGQNFLVSTQMKSFFQQYCIRLIKQRQNQETKYITKLSLPNQKEQNYGLIALQFQTCQNQTSQLVSLNQNSQILISTTKKYQNCPVFVLNHLNRDRNQLFNYFGFADQTIEKSCEARVKLLPLVFQQNYYNIDPTYQHLTQFNFHQTQTSVIFFWPVLYDAKQALLHNFQRISYNPKITSLFFVGSKADLRFLSHLQPVNESYRSIHPRIGCTCYQLPLSNSIYVFGGFYTDIDNYMDFQTDISVIKLEKDFGISIENVPKSFFMNFQQQSSFKMVTSVNNDFVRPRVQYEVYELQNQVSDVRQILLLGGVGEKFTRPFSLIGYMAHLIRFQGPYLSKIDRIKINNIVPANLSRPIKSRANSQMPLIKVAQNRRIYASKSSIHPGVLTFSSFKPKYISQDQNQDKKCLGKHMARNRRMTYTKNYEVALQEKWTQLQYPKQNTYTVSLREGNQTRSYRCILRHYSYKSKNQASVLLTIEAKQLLFLNLIFCLQDDAAEKFINLQGKTVKLAPHNVLAADTFFKDVFVLFYHQQFSQGMFVLARSNVKNTTQLIQNGVRQLVLNQIYSFDFMPQKCIIKVVQGQGQQIALLHGLSFSEQNYEEYLLKRIGSYYTRLPIYRSDLPLQIGHSILMSKSIVQPNKKSFIIGSGHKIFCISFITIERVQGTAQVFYVVVEELNLNETVLKWRIKSHNKFIFELNTQEIIEFQTRDQNRPPEQQIIFRTKNYMVNKQILDVYETTESRDIFIVLTDQRYIYEGSINIENLGKFNNLLFLPIKSQDRFMLYQNYGTQRLRDRSNGFHIYAKAIDKDTTGIRSQTQIISQEIGTIDIL